MLLFKPHDRVRVVRLPVPREGMLNGGLRPPRVGEIGEVVLAYDFPVEGYLVECPASDGSNVWLADFSPEDVEGV
jgi:hypothetical protein